MAVTGQQVNTFTNGDIDAVSFTSMQQTTLDVLQSHENVMLSNYESGNTSALGILAGSKIAVNWVLYTLDNAGVFDAKLGDGSVVAINSAPDGDYYIIFTPNVDGTVTGYAKQISSGNVAINSTYGGWYETSTQNRIVGGFTKTGTSYTRKWVYQTKGGANEKPDFNYRMFPDGLEFIAHVNQGVEIPVYEDSDASEKTPSTVTIISPLIVRAPCNAVLRFTGYAADVPQEPVLAYHAPVVKILFYLKDGGGNILGVNSSITIEMPQTSADLTAVAPLTQGVYQVSIQYINGVWETAGQQDEPNIETPAPVYQESATVSLMDVYALPKGTY